MSSSYDRFERRSQPSRRSTLGHWVPLIATVAIATIGLAAWVWSERQDDDEDTPDYAQDDGGSVRTAPPVYGDLREGEIAYGTTSQQPEESSSYMARMSGALRRTPSPQQVFDGASRTVVGSLAAAGAVVGSALSSIREEVKDPYADHRTWSEEAELRKAGISNVSERPQKVETSQKATNAYKKTVAVVVSANLGGHDELDNDDGYHHEHASILSYLPRNTDFSKIALFVLIYSPKLKDHPLSTNIRRTGDSISSSFTNIEYEQAQTPTEESQKLLASSSTDAAFQAVYSEAQSLVENEMMVMPFTTPTGHEHMLRHLGPDIIYLQESLAGENGEVVTHLQSWLRQDVVIVVGADSGNGGLADSEDEVSRIGKEEHWWEREERVGRGRGVVVVEGLNVGEDWAKRVEGKE